MSRTMTAGVAILAAALLAPGAVSLAQVQVGTAHSLDDNLRLGSGGYNSPGRGGGGGGRIAGGGPVFRETLYRGGYGQIDYYNAFHAQRRYDPGRAGAFRDDPRRFESGQAGISAGPSRFAEGYDKGYRTGFQDAAAGPPPMPESAQKQMEQISYALGFFLGEDLRASMANDEVETDIESVIGGFRDGLFENAPRLPKVEIEEMLADLNTEVESRIVDGLNQRDPKFRELAESNLQRSRAFHEEFGRREGVVTLPNGIQYQVLVAGAGSPHPGGDDDVVLNYKVILLDGSVLSEGTGVEVRVGGVVDGGSQALQMMSPGAKWLIAIPPELAHGAGGKYPQIGPNVTLFCEVELMDIK